MKLLKLASVFEKKASVIGDVGHVFLDVIGIIPGVGELADMTNTLWYLSEGDYLFAALSLVSIIPEIGDLIGKGGKFVSWLSKTFPKSTKTVSKYGPEVADNIKFLRAAIKSNRDLIDKLFKKAEENERLRQYIPKMREALDIFNIEGQEKEENYV